MKKVTHTFQGEIRIMLRILKGRLTSFNLSLHKYVTNILIKSDKDKNAPRDFSRALVIYTLAQCIYYYDNFT